MTPRTEEEEEEEEEVMKLRDRPDLEEEPQGLLLNLERARMLSNAFLYFLYLDWYEVREIIAYYQDSYMRHMKSEHPVISQEKFLYILEELPFYRDENGNRQDLVDWYGNDEVVRRYKRAIDIHFKTKYRGNCDYSIIHFFSGRIRLYRFRDLEKEEMRTNILIMDNLSAIEENRLTSQNMAI